MYYYENRNEDDNKKKSLDILLAYALYNAINRF